MKEALFYVKAGGKKVRCNLCPSNCLLNDGSRGLCNARKNTGGVLETLTYGKVSSLALDPIEKKPLDYFMPGSHILSVGTFGCNFKCSFCQNYHISREMPAVRELSPSELCEAAGNLKNNIGIAFTYNEPIIWYEYVLDTSKLAKELGLKVVLVTNGYINPEPLEEIIQYVDAMNIDLKAFNDEFYRNICGGHLEPVKETIKAAVKKCHVEITNLSIPGLNDSEEEMEKMSSWLASVDKSIPFHIIPFRPMYKMTDRPLQNFRKLIELQRIAKKFLNRVII
jgi:pyruvate formate lyase activating enzyme